MSRTSRIVLSLLCMLVSSSLIGCTTFHLPFEKKLPKATANDPCVEIVCLWQPGEGRDPDGAPCKGFSGQILFLCRSSSTPVQIDGDVRFYLFDDQGTAEEQSRPLRQFDFDHGAWSVHLSDSSFGPTYSVFIPYVRRGVSNAACSLRVRLKPKNGPVVFSDFTNMNLDGHKKAATGEAAQPLTKEEVDKVTADTMTGALTRTTTISTGPNPKVTEVVAPAKKEASPNQIQLASHEVTSPATRPTSEADRVQKLEAMVQQLLEQKTNMAAASNLPIGSNRSAMISNPGVEPAPLNLESSGQTPLSDDTQSNRRIKLRQRDDEETTRIVPRRRPHPLDDEPSYRPRSKRDERVGRELYSEEESDSAMETTYMNPAPLSDQRYRRTAR